MEPQLFFFVSSLLNMLTMKKFSLWMVLLFIGSATLQQCTDSDESASPEKVQFTVSFKVPDGASGRTKEDVIPDALILSVERSTGESVLLNERIELLRVGDSFITEPLELQRGIYRITDFMLVKENTVVYATPRSGSPLAKVVTHSLPVQIQVSRNRVTNVNMEVIDVTLAEPEQFGYLSFEINAVNVLNLGVLVQNGNDYLMTNARAYLLEGEDTVERYVLQAAINLLSFRGDKQMPRKLVVVKPGYNTLVKEFVYADLIEELEGRPWTVKLVASSFTITPFLEGPAGLYYEMQLGGMPGNLMIDWGDGTIEPYAIATDQTVAKHDYLTLGDFKINITGDLDKITIFYQFYGIGETEAINLQGLTELKSMNFGWTPHGPRVIDLSQNTKLENLMVANIPQLEKLILPDQGITWMEVTGPFSMSIANVNTLVDQIHQNVVTHNVMDGTLLIRNHYRTDEILGPPSAAQLDKLRELRDTYGWSISPDPL
jgi:hypothetical protein